MPVSIVDYENLIKDELTLGLFQDLYRMNDILKLVPVVEVGSLVVRGQQWATLPTQGFRDINETFTPSTGKTEPVEDRLAIWGGEFQVDKVFGKLSTPVLRDPTQLQFDMHNVAMDRGITDNFFNGAVSANPKGFNGIYTRVKTGTIGGSNNAHIVSANDDDNDTLKVHASADNAKKFFQKLDEAMYLAGLYGSAVSKVPRGALFMNKTSWLGMQVAARLTGYNIDNVDLLEWQFKAYRGVPMVDVGRQRDQATEIILDTYDPGDAGNDSSRIYVCRFAPPDGDVKSPGSKGLVLAQVGAYEVLGPEEYNTYEKYAMQWILGPTHIGDKYCAAMLDDFKMAAA